MTAAPSTARARARWTRSTSACATARSRSAGCATALGTAERGGGLSRHAREALPVGARSPRRPPTPRSPRARGGATPSRRPSRCSLVEALTGVAMMTVYSRREHRLGEHLHSSIVLPWGALVRALHHWASQGLVVLLEAHLAAAAVAKAYRAARELAVVLGLGLAGLTLAFCTTGFPSRGPAPGYWALARRDRHHRQFDARDGPCGAARVLGGARFTAPSRSRASYHLRRRAPHALLVGLVMAHVALVRRLGTARATAATPRKGGGPRRPRDAVGALAAVLVVARSRVRGSTSTRRPTRRASTRSGGARAISHPAPLPGAETAHPRRWRPGLVTYLAALPVVDRPSRRHWRGARGAAPPRAGGGGCGLPRLEMKSHDAADHNFQQTTANARGVPRDRAGADWACPRRTARHAAQRPARRPRSSFKQHCGVCHAARDVADQHGPRLDGSARARLGDGLRRLARPPRLMGTVTQDMGERMGPRRRLSTTTTRAVAGGSTTGASRRSDPADAALVTRPGADRRCSNCHLGRITRWRTTTVTRRGLDSWGSRGGSHHEQVVSPQRLEQCSAHQPRLPPPGEAHRAREPRWSSTSPAFSLRTREGARRQVPTTPE